MLMSIDTCSKWDEEEEVLACASLTGMGRWRRGAGDEYVRLCGGVVGVGCEARRGGDRAVESNVTCQRRSRMRHWLAYLQTRYVMREEHERASDRQEGVAVHRWEACRSWRGAM
jgi:hypothetical protein